MIMHMIKSDRHGILFILVTVLWTWGVLLVPVAARLHFSHPVTRIAYVLAGASPSVLALAFVFLTGNPACRQAFLRRIIRPDLIGAKGYAFIGLFIPAVTAVSVLAQTVVTGSPPDLSRLISYAQRPHHLLLFAGATFVLGPLAEEIGWRGYLFDRLADRGPLARGVFIGVVWSLWHLPMFLIAGTYQSGLIQRGLWPVVCFFISTVALGVIMGEVVTRHHRSILAAILFHFMINFTGELVPLGTAGELVRTGLYVLFCILLPFAPTEPSKNRVF
jgi:membrane protease YdiL (CAAX protease family)